MNLPLQLVHFDEILADPEQNIRRCDPVKIKHLAARIKARGLLQPLGVSPSVNGSGKHPLRFGHRRYAALALNLSEGMSIEDQLRGRPLAVIIEPGEDEDDAAENDGATVPIGIRAALLDGLSENHDREEMTLMDYAELIPKLTATGMTKKEIAKELHKSDGWVSVVSHFPELRPWIQERIRAGTLAFKLARELRGKTDAEQDKLIADADRGGATKAAVSASKPKRKGKSTVNVKRVASDVDKYLTEISQREKVTAREERAVTAQRHMLKCLAGKMSPSQLHARVMELV